MKKVFQMDLQRFSGSLTLTTYYDSGYSACSASASSSLAENDEVTYTITMGTGKEFAECEIISGGATYNPTTKKLKMGASNAVVYFKSKANKTYKLLENVYVNVNGSATTLKRNVLLVKGATGEVYDVQSSGTDLSSVSADVVAALVKAGIAVKI